MSEAAQLSEIQRSLGRIEGAIPEFTTRVEAIEKDAGELGKRVHSLEKWRWYAGGVIALGGVLLSAFVFR